MAKTHYLPFLVKIGIIWGMTPAGPQIYYSSGGLSVLRKPDNQAFKQKKLHLKSSSRWKVMLIYIFSLRLNLVIFGCPGLLLSRL